MSVNMKRTIGATPPPAMPTRGWRSAPIACVLLGSGGVIHAEQSGTIYATMDAIMMDE